ncbi:MAG: hypothetical protein AAFW47_08615 [Pseudomonadota bacterium]
MKFFIAVLAVQFSLVFTAPLFSTANACGLVVSYATDCGEPFKSSVDSKEHPLGEEGEKKAKKKKKKKGLFARKNKKKSD